MEPHAAHEPLVYDFAIVRDLPPQNDPKGGAAVPGATPEPTKKPKSDQIRHTSFGDYLSAHAHPNGNGFRGFFRSNLFAALTVWILSQVVLIGGSVLLTYARTNQLIEWRAGVDTTLKRMDDWGTTHGHYADERQDANIIELQARTKAISDLNSQLTQLMTQNSERNTQQDKELASVQARLSEMAPTLVEIKAKLVFVADLLDERTKNKR